MKKLNEAIADKDFLTKSGIDLAKFNAAARKAYAKNKDLLAAIGEIESLQMREAPKADSTEAKGRSQVINRHVLEMLYGGVLRNQAPVKRSGVIYRSADGGATWKKMTEYKHTGGSALVNQTEAGYYARLYVDAQNDQTLYACDTNTTVSTDGGKTFKATGWDAGAYKLHVDHRALWLDPQNSNHILSGNDGGAGETWDGGKHWSQKSTISAQQFYDIAADNEMPYNIMGGTQDNGAWIGPSQTRNAWGVFAADWRYLPTGDGFFVVRDWWNPEYIYYESQFGSSSRRTSRPARARNWPRGRRPRRWPRGCPPNATSGTPRSSSRPTIPGIVYICSQFVHRSLSRGEPGYVRHHQPRPHPGPTRRASRRPKKTNLQYATIYTFAESAKKPGLYWAGTDDGNVQVIDRRRRHLDQHHVQFLRHEDRQAQARRQGRPHPLRPLGQEGRALPLRREHLLRGFQRLPDPQRGQDLALRHPRPGQDLGGHLRRPDESALRRRRGPGQSQRPLHRRPISASRSRSTRARPGRTSPLRRRTSSSAIWPSRSGTATSSSARTAGASTSPTSPRSRS